MGWFIAFIVSAAISWALAPKPPPSAPPATLDQFDVPSASEGKPIPVVFGTVLIKSPNVVWYGDLRVVPIKSKGGKK